LNIAEYVNNITFSLMFLGLFSRPCHTDFNTVAANTNTNRLQSTIGHESVIGKQTISMPPPPPTGVVCMINPLFYYMLYFYGSVPFMKIFKASASVKIVCSCLRVGSIVSSFFVLNFEPLLSVFDSFPSHSAFLTYDYLEIVTPEFGITIRTDISPLHCS